MNPIGPALRLGVPAYFHPVRESADWAGLIVHDQHLGIIVVNPDSGVGAPDTDYRELLRRLHERSLATIAGYLDVDYAQRPVSEVLDEARRWAGMYGVSAIFVDRTCSGPADVRYHRTIADGLRSLGVRTVVFNPGVPPDREYFDLADTVVTFEGDWSDYRAMRHRPDDRGSSWHLVHGTPVDRFGDVLELARERGAAFVYATERTLPNPWNGWPAPYGDLLS